MLVPSLWDPRARYVNPLTSAVMSARLCLELGRSLAVVLELGPNTFLMLWRCLVSLCFTLFVGLLLYVG